MIMILLFMSDFWLGAANLKKWRVLEKQKNEKRMSITQHPKRWRNCCMHEDQKKEIRTIFTK